ncbi:hypothetical protein Prudu_014807, partial [Prunus dulcis]
MTKYREKRERIEEVLYKRPAYDNCNLVYYLQHHYVCLTLDSHGILGGRKWSSRQSVENMPFALSLANFCNGIVWLIYALLEFESIHSGNSLNIFVIVLSTHLFPTVGSISGLVQLILYTTYHKTTNWNEDDEKPNKEFLASIL